MSDDSKRVREILHRHVERKLATANADLARLTAENAELREDKARLSWAVNYTDRFSSALEGIVWTCNKYTNEVMWRAKVDAARKGGNAL